MSHDGVDDDGGDDDDADCDGDSGDDGYDYLVRQLVLLVM